ncbi:MAG: SCO family protein [Deltaproteobacteria bacterium]|nr:SCO family protein [Deltaproteobacteria bacterium]
MRSLLFFFISSLCWANQQMPEAMQGAGVDEKLGYQVSIRSLAFVDEASQPVLLKDFVRGEKPVVLMMGYYKCPKLCSLILSGFISAAKAVHWTLGNEYDLVMVSIDTRETPEIAAKKKANYVKYYGRTGSERGIHFLTATQENIGKLADEIGFHFKYDERIEQFAHPAVLVVLSPGGLITRYIYGIDFRAKDLKLALIEGSEGKVGTVIERFLLYCYQFDPNLGTYSVAVVNLMKIGGLLTVLGLLFYLWLFWRSEINVARRWFGGNCAAGSSKKRVTRPSSSEGTSDSSR